MAKVYLAFHESDLIGAHAAAAALEARGHQPLLPQDPEEADKYRNTADAMIIVATPAALLSPLVLEDVRVAQHRRIPRLALMPEGAESEIDEEYLVQFTLRQRSSDINELIDNLEGRESRVMFSRLGDSRIKAAAQPSQTIFLEALQREEAERRQREHRREQALETEQGKLVHKINNRMRNGRREIVEVRLASSETPNLALGLVGSGSLVAEELPIVQTMTIELVSPNDAFVITPQTRRTQLVTGELLRGVALDAQYFGRWLWAVVPKKAGRHDLVVRVSADVRDGRGLPSSTALPDRLFKIRVSIDYSKTAVSTAEWISIGLAGVVLAGLVGAFTQDVWWPQLKVWLGY